MRQNNNESLFAKLYRVINVTIFHIKINVSNVI